MNIIISLQLFTGKLPFNLPFRLAQFGSSVCASDEPMACDMSSMKREKFVNSIESLPLDSFFFLLASIFILVWFADHSVCSCAAMWCYLVERVWLFASVVTLCGLLPQDQNYFLTQHKTIIVFTAKLHQSTYAPHLIRKFNSMFMN